MGWRVLPMLQLFRLTEQQCAAMWPVLQMMTAARSPTMKCKDVLHAWTTSLPSIMLHKALKKLVDRHHQVEHSRICLEAAWRTVQYQLDCMQHQEYIAMMAKIGL